MPRVKYLPKQSNPLQICSAPFLNSPEYPTASRQWTNRNIRRQSNFVLTCSLLKDVLLQSLNED